MKIVKKSLLVCGGPGNVEMVPLDADDLWFIYNLIAIGDSVTGVTVRKVVKENGKKGDAERVKLKLEIKVDKIPEYDQQGGVVRVTGKNTTENEHVKQGAYHSLQLELNRPFVLKKKNWDSLALQELNQACDPAASADLAVVIMQEGLAHIMLVGRSMTITRAKIETSIPRNNKHGNNSAQASEKSLTKFFENVARSFHKHVDFSIVRCAVLASPGLTKDQFHKHLLLEAERKNLRQIIENKSKIVLVHTSSGNKHSLKEVLDAPNVMNRIKDTKAAKEVRALQEFQSMLSGDEHRACYGPKHVEVANEQMAVKTLLITDELLRNADVATRRKYVDLVDSVKGSKGEVHVFSSMHVSGEQLAQLTGVAAILRFPLAELEEIEM